MKWNCRSHEILQWCKHFYKKNRQPLTRLSLGLYKGPYNSLLVQIQGTYLYYQAITFVLLRLYCPVCAFSNPFRFFRAFLEWITKNSKYLLGKRTMGISTQLTQKCPCPFLTLGLVINAWIWNRVLWNAEFCRNDSEILIRHMKYQCSVTQNFLNHILWNSESLHC